MADPQAHHEPDVTLNRRNPWRVVGTWLMLVVFCIGILGSLGTIWARLQILDTDVYVETVTPLASDAQIQQAVADRVTTILSDRIQQAQANISDRDPIADGAVLTVVLDLVHRKVLELVSSESFESFWISANRAAHQHAVDAHSGDGQEMAFIENGQFVLNLSPLIAEAEQRLKDAGVDIVDRIDVDLDPSETTFVLYESEGLATLQDDLETAETLAVVLPIVTLIALAACLLLATDRWQMVTWVGLGTALSMVVTLVILSVLRDRYLESLPAGRNVDALAAAFEIIFRNLRLAVRVTTIAGLVVAGFAAVVTSSWLRQPRSIDFISRYRGALIAGILALACGVLVAADHPSLELALGVGVIAFAAVLVVIWFARMPTQTTSSDLAPEAVG